MTSEPNLYRLRGAWRVAGGWTLERPGVVAELLRKAKWCIEWLNIVVLLDAIATQNRQT